VLFDFARILAILNVVSLRWSANSCSIVNQSDVFLKAYVLRDAADGPIRCVRLFSRTLGIRIEHHLLPGVVCEKAESCLADSSEGLAEVQAKGGCGLLTFFGCHQVCARIADSLSRLANVLGLGWYSEVLSVRHETNCSTGIVKPYRITRAEVLASMVRAVKGEAVALIIIRALFLALLERLICGGVAMRNASSALQGPHVFVINESQSRRSGRDNSNDNVGRHIRNIYARAVRQFFDPDVQESISITMSKT
jgi:hypothetical protein